MSTYRNSTQRNFGQAANTFIQPKSHIGDIPHLGRQWAVFPTYRGTRVGICAIPKNRSSREARLNHWYGPPNSMGSRARPGSPCGRYTRRAISNRRHYGSIPQSLRQEANARKERSAETRRQSAGNLGRSTPPACGAA